MGKANGTNGSGDVLKDSLRMGKDAFGRSQIFGEPVREDGTVLVPVGRMRGGAGGGSGTGPVAQKDGSAGALEGIEPGQPLGEGSGHGWGMDAKATGAYVIRDGKVSYVPAVDVNRIVIAGVAGLVALLVLTPRIIRAAKR